MKRIEACFACTTPYQVLGAIAIEKSRKMEADIYIFGMFKGYTDIAENLRKQSIFRKVIDVDCSEYYKYSTRYVAIIQMFGTRRITKDFVEDDITYNCFFTSSRAHIKTLFLHEMLRRNKELKIIIYDDGLGMYAKQSHVLNTSPMRVRTERFLGWNVYTKERACFLVNMPILFEKPSSFKELKVEQMPRIKWNEDNRRLILEVFGATERDTIKEQVIIFDSLRGLDPERDRKMRIMDDYFTLISKFFGRENTIIKPHPRSTETSIANISLYNNTSIPMEALYAGMNDLDKRILVTYASSAVYTPKMFFDSEPWVINLFRLTDNYGDKKSEWEDSYKKFKEIYKEQEKVMAPRTKDELEKCIKGIIV